MKPYVIFPYIPDNQHEVGVPIIGRRDNYYVMQQVFKDPTPASPSLFFANTLGEAELVANSLAAENPGVQIMIANTSAMFTTPKPDPAKAVIFKAKFTEAGLLPF